jgi:hypothetical protein
MCISLCIAGAYLAALEGAGTFKVKDDASASYS